MKGLFLPHAWFKFWTYVKENPYEISMLGEVVKHDDSPLVTDIFLLEQVGGSAETDITADGQQAMLEAMLISGKPLERIRFWGHSHPTFNAFMSGTDVNTINTLGSTLQDGWLFSVCGNHKGEYFARLDTWLPWRLTVEKLEIAQYTGDRIEIVSGIYDDVFVQQFSEQNSAIDALYNQISELEKALKAPIKEEIALKVKPKPVTVYTGKGNPKNIAKHPNCAGCADPTKVHDHSIELTGWQQYGKGDIYRNKYRCPSIQCDDTWNSFGDLNEEEMCPKCMMSTKPHHSELYRVKEFKEQELPYMNFYECKKDMEFWSDLATDQKETDPCPKCHELTYPWQSRLRTDLQVEAEKSKESRKVKEKKGKKFQVINGGNQPQA